MDPAQQPAEPTPPVTDSALARTLKPSAPAPAAKPTTEEENLKHAADELAAITLLRSLSDFKWFEETFIMKPYREARAKLLSEHLMPEENLAQIKSRFAGLKHVAVGVLQRELAHREKLDPRDPEIARLREKLASM